MSDSPVSDEALASAGRWSSPTIHALRLQLAAKAVGLGLAEADLRTGQMHFDEQACRNHGLPYPHGPYTVEDWVAQIHPDDQARARQSLAEAAHSRHPIEGLYRFAGPGGALRWLEILVQSQIDAQGDCATLLGTCRDVTEVHELALLRQDKEAAERTSRAKSAFLSRASHELRTPLNSILGFAQLMARDAAVPLPPAQQGRLDNILRSGQILLALIDDMLELSRAEPADFPLSLPKAVAPGHLTAPLEPASPAPTHTLLYVEDQSLNVLLLKGVLQARPHWQLLVAPDGASALRLASQCAPALLLIDMHLPDMDGLEVLRRLREQSPDHILPMPCVALSADATPARIDQARAAGFVDYWTKPIDVQRVLADLDRWLDARPS